MSANIKQAIRPTEVVAVDARYVTSPLEEFRGNPYIEALPQEVSEEHLGRSLPVRPPYNPRERNLPRHLRSHCILRLLRFFEPLGRHYDLALRLDMLMRSGYVDRNPTKPEFRIRIQENYERSQDGDFSDESLEVEEFPNQSMSLIGISGMGKTRTLKRILSKYPQRIFHTNYGLTQIPWLFVECPHDGSLKELCLAFFKAVDRVFGNHFYETRYGRDRVTADQRLLQVAEIAWLHGVGLIVFDELQHIRAGGPKGVEKLLNSFVTLINLSTTPIVLVGTMAAQHILQFDFRQARRGSGLGGMVWDRCACDGEFGLLLKDMWPYQWTKYDSPCTEEIVKVFYRRTQGVLELAVKLYILAQYRAIATGYERITPELVNAVADAEFKLLEPMLEALASGDPCRIAKYDDLQPLDFEKLIKREQLRMTSRVDASALRERLKREQEELDAAVDKEVDDSTNGAAPPAPDVGQTPQCPKPRSGKTATRAKTSEGPFDGSDLRKVVELGDGSISPYDALLKNGNVRGPMDVLAE